ncbi:hypothetical protein U1872_14375 [Sphingomonas sp. RB3P16]|uniref:hypothetical protein n=1 Tax=Parasphingomonas frigoris TaxID=3096163 RepID=UPI002FC5EECA
MHCAIVGLMLWATAASATSPAPAETATRPASAPQPGSNPEMTALFDADQKARDTPATIDWKILWPADRARRARTQVLLDTGALHSGDDFYHAAYLFQHGETPADFLKAHTLAVIAAARGKPQAVWIAAATLDRYLQRIGQPQVYGTQFQRAPGHAWTQEPYQRDLLSDALRQATNVPMLVDQAKQLEDYRHQPG